MSFMNNEESIRTPLLQNEDNNVINNQNTSSMEQFKEKFGLSSDKYEVSYSKKTGTLHLKTDSANFAFYGYDEEKKAFYKIKNLEDFLKQGSNMLFAKAISKFKRTTKMSDDDLVLCFGSAFVDPNPKDPIKHKFTPCLRSARVSTALEYVYGDGNNPYKKSPSKALIEQPSVFVQNKVVEDKSKEERATPADIPNTKPQVLENMQNLISNKEKIEEIKNSGSTYNVQKNEKMTKNKKSSFWNFFSR